ncbi:uncharacterized protein LOC114961960 isoform X2 [Acropora millepora]|uniref:uncharacterized protein LOC114961960 isoform X2 n=1 Tax=Acropora millepora TaxID=45264 RepID=UPI001CF5578D|nr:uncharacterized protein LOC114961960 isoform X2 [Acropora millepora]
MAGAGAAAAGYCHEVCSKLTQAIMEIVNSSHFVKKEFAERSLNLTQAYCLLWQESKDGAVDGKMELRAGAVSAAIVDLIVLDKIEIESEPKSCLGFKYENALLKVKSESPTGTFLDDALFDKILEKHEKSPEKPKEVQHYMENDIWKFNSEKTCAYKTLANLVELGILDKKKTFFGKKYPTLNPAHVVATLGSNLGTTATGSECPLHTSPLLILLMIRCLNVFKSPSALWCFFYGIMVFLTIRETTSC